MSYDLDLDIPDFLKRSIDNQVSVEIEPIEEEESIELIEEEEIESIEPIEDEPIDELLDQLVEKLFDSQIVKRGRGRPKGLLNAKSLLELVELAEVKQEVVKRGRGRPKGSGKVKEVKSTIDNRGKHILGKLWVLNRELGIRSRIDADQLSKFQAHGYVVAGPRTK